MKVLSLFDGMACGMIAMQLAEVEVESYDAYEIDKYAIKTAQHNFPMIEEHGDVFKADFTQYEGVDFLVGGSPCTYWSIAQTKNRETVASGMGWELFSQYVRALHEAKPKYFIYENNKSMSKQIRQSIDDTFGFEAVLINSALVSAQNRQRLYWVGRRNEDGTYSKVNVEQPEDRGVLLKDVLDSAVAMRELAAEPINTDTNGKSFCVTSRYYKGFGNNPGKCLEKHRDSMVAEPINVTADGKSQTIKATYNFTSISNICCYSSTYGSTGVATPTEQEPSEQFNGKGKDVNAMRRVYKVYNGEITIKNKQYPVKLSDGYYIIRKLTVSECKRLQTVPEWYDFSCVSNSQAYKMLGNGWTCEVITHLIKSCLNDKPEEYRCNETEAGMQYTLF